MGACPVQPRPMTHRLEVTPEGILEVEYFGTTTFADRASALDALSVDTGPGTKRVLVNVLGAQVVGGDDGSRLDFIAKAITHPLLENCRVAMLGIPAADAHASQTAGLIRQIKVRTFDDRAEAVAWLLAG